MAQSIRLPARPVPAQPAMRYVSGETRYMKSQKPGRASGVWRTPLKVKAMLKRSVAMLPAVSASGRAAMTMWAKVEANMKN